jgi:NOL1/NOP2/fmu family ribosome biogenesis protein
VLDLCAAPGGKSTLLQSIISPQSILVSNEVIKSRVNILSENICKWGAANVVVTNNDPQHFQKLTNYFDVIVVDAPCSGSGLFRKDANAVDEWSEENVTLCSRRQQRILADVLPALKNGGLLVYSTCSYSAAEDEDVCKWITDNFLMDTISLKIDEAWGIVASSAGYRFYPYKVKGEGFFIAAFRKKADEYNETTKPAKQKSIKQSAKDIETVRQYLQNPNDFSFIQVNDEYIALPGAVEKELPVLQQALYIKKAGVKMGSIVQGQLLPAHELALSTCINKNIPSVTLDKETALQYLRREEIKIDTAIKGWCLVCFEMLPLGWVKILPNRVNNYYPKEWRILNK